MNKNKNISIHNCQNCIFNISDDVCMKGIEISTCKIVVENDKYTFTGKIVLPVNAVSCTEYTDDNL